MHRGMDCGGAKLFRWEPKVMIQRFSNIKFKEVLLENWVNDERECLALK
jgi:hypothetical protein